MRRSLIAVLPVVLLIAGCGGKSPTEASEQPAQYRSVTDIRDALERSGLGCADFQTVGPENRDIGETKAQEAATCRVENTDVTMMIWLRLGQAQDWAQSSEVMQCQLSQANGNAHPVYVDGGRWTVALKSRPVANKISEAIGGDVKFPDCTSQD